MLGIARAAVALVFVVALAGCGGGGGGGGPSVPRGAFTLSGTTATFNAKRSGPLPPAVTLQMQLTGSDIAAVGAAYRDGITPAPWLDINVTGSGTTYSVLFTVNSTQIAAGTYTTTVSVGTGDSGGNVLQFKDVQVSYSLRDGVSISSPPIAVSATLGHSTSSFDVQLPVTAPNFGWAVTANVPWISDPGGAHQGTGIATLTIDTSTLGLGAANATVTVTNTADATDTATVPVTVTVAAPALVLTLPPGAPFGGTSGLDMEPRAAIVDLYTGSNFYPWTAQFVPTSGGDWLELSGTSGTVNEAGLQIALTPKPNALAMGSYTGNLVVTANVNGTQVAQSAPVSLNVDQQRIWASATGVGLSSFPNRQTLTRTLRVFNSLNRTDLDLVAQSNQSWLQASAPDGKSIVLTADASALAADQFHSATVTVSSTDPRIANQEVIRVGLWRGSADPAAEVTVTANALYLAASPVEPLLFANDLGNGNIEVFNVYTGAAVRTLPVGVVGPMTMSGDGSVLYISDYTTGRLLAIDPQTGSTLRSYQTAFSSNPTGEMFVAYARPEGHAILVSGASSEAFDEATGTKLEGELRGRGQVVADKSGHRIYIQENGFSPTALSMTEVRYSTFLNPAGLVIESTLTNTGHNDPVYLPSNGLDIALTEDDQHVYRASGHPYGFGVADPLTLLGQVFLPATAYAAAVGCGWRGYCYGSAGPDSMAPNQDLWIYDANQQYVGGRTLGSQNLYRGGIELSADDTRVIIGLTMPPNDMRRIKIIDTPQ